MPLASIVADFLLSNEQHICSALGKLDFYVDGFHVDPEGYREIGHKIREGAITVTAGARTQGSSIEASYTPLRNQFSVPPDLDLSGTSAAAIGRQVTIVHETTHALMDYHVHQTTGTVQEIAAYLAGELYNAAHSRRRSAAHDPPTDAILRATYEIIEDRGMLTATGARLRTTDADVARLAHAIEAHSAYRDARVETRTDGIAGLNNPWYPSRRSNSPSNR